MFAVLVKAAVLAVLPVAHHPAAHVATQHVTVQSGDSLSSIATAQCGKANDWTGIWVHSRAIVGPNPNLILPGQRLKVVCEDPPALLKYGLNQTPAAPVHTAAAPAATGGSYGHPNYCGDGDGDGWDVACPSQAQPDPQQGNAQAPAAAPAQPAAAYSGAPGSFQACVIRAESGGNPSAYNASSGAGGLYQFLQSTWSALGFPGSPQNAPVSEQNAAFAKAYAQSGTSPWAPYDGC